MLSKSTFCLGINIIPPDEDLKFSRVKSLAVHQILQLLGGSPVFSYDSHLEYVYAIEALSSADYSEWTIRFEPEARFSDGSPLRASHWYHSIARNILYGSGVHFNPKHELLGGVQSTDGYCEGLQLVQDAVRLKLVRPNRALLRSLGKVEATVLPLAHASDPSHDIRNLSSSGPFSIEERRTNELLLKRNKYFPHREGRMLFEAIRIIADDSQGLVARRRSGELDFILPQLEPDISAQSNLGQTYPYHLETIFLSFRNRRSPWTERPSLRTTLAARLATRQTQSKIQTTTTIFQGQGLGRVPSGPRFANLKITLPKISIAAVDSDRSRAIMNDLASAIELDVLWVRTFDALFGSAASSTDAFLGWNDFSAKDPYISWYNALNPERQLFYDDGTFRTMLEKIQTLASIEERDVGYQNLQQALLESAGSIPLYRSNKIGFAAKELNLNGMISTCLWTMKS